MYMRYVLTLSTAGTFWWSAGVGRVRAPPLRNDPHRGPVAEHLRDPIHDLGGVVPDGDERIRAERLRVLYCERKCVGPRLLAQLRQERDVTAAKLLQQRSDRAEHGARANGDAAYHSHS